MSDIILPGGYTRQPSHNVGIHADWEEKVVFASVTAIDGGRDSVSKQFPAVVGSMSKRASPRGIASNADNATSGLAWSSLKPVPSIFNTGMAFLILANPSAGGTQQRALFLGDEIAAGGSFNQATVAFNADKATTATSGMFSAVEYNFGYQAATQSVAGTIDGNWHVFICNRPAGFGAWSLYRDGVDVSSTSTPANGIVLNAGTRVHINPGATVGYPGSAVLAVVFNGPLRVKEIIDLSLNPWRILRAPTKRLWFEVSAGAYTLTASPGTFGVTGTPASLKYGRVLQAAPGSFALTGAAATLKKGYKLQAASGSFSATGTAATLKHNRILQAAAASFQVSGTAASLKYGRVLAAAPGTFQITGTDATLAYGTAGSYTLTASAGSFSVAGTAATLRYGRKLSADSGVFAFTGTAATLRYARRVIAESGTFSLTGTDATLTYSGAAGPVTSTVERTAIFRAFVARSTKFQRSKSVTVKFN